MKRKIFLIVSGDEDKKKRYTELIRKLINDVTVYHATDGSTALAKLKNAPPHVVITDVDLPKVSGLQLIDYILKDVAFSNIAILIMDQLPKSESFMDELVTGRIQYLEGNANEDEFSRCVTRALNFATHGEKAALFHARFLAQGDVLMSEGDKAEFVYILKSGRLSAYQTVNNKQVVLGNIEPGEFVGEMAYINGEPRSATVVALSQCELIEVPMGSFDIILYKRPAWAKSLVHVLSKRLKQANAAIGD